VLECSSQDRLQIRTAEPKRLSSGTPTKFRNGRTQRLTGAAGDGYFARDSSFLN
jgi:hypothetical protein